LFDAELIHGVRAPETSPGQVPMEKAVTVMIQLDEQQTIVKILRESHTVAVVGLSSNPDRPSHEVARYLQKRGYLIIPVNPTASDVLGQPAYPDLPSIPHTVDVVDIFRRPEAVAAIVEHAIQIRAKAVWMQKGVVHQKAAEQARAAGLLVVMDRCMKIEHAKLNP